MNFLPYLKLNLKMVQGDLILIAVCGVLFWFSMQLIIGVFFMPWIMLGIGLLTIRPGKKLFEDSIFGPSSALHMSLPVDARTFVLVKILAGSLVGLIGLGAAVLPLLVTGFQFHVVLRLDELVQAAHTGGNGTAVLILLGVDLILFLFMAMPVGLAHEFWYNAQPLRNQSPALKYGSRILINAPFSAFILWNAFRDKEKTPVFDWLSEGNPLPVLIVVAVVLCIMSLLAVRRAVNLLENHYQKL